jgi:hypothetical protein
MELGKLCSRISGPGRGFTNGHADWSGRGAHQLGKSLLLVLVDWVRVYRMEQLLKGRVLGDGAQGWVCSPVL